MSMIGCWRYIKVKEGLWVEDLVAIYIDRKYKKEWVGRGSNESHVGQVEFEMPLESNKQRPGLVCSHWNPISLLMDIGGEI